MRLLDALTDLAGSLVDALDADACAVSRVLGDVLLFVTQSSRDGRSLALGQGFLVSEYPQTADVLERGEPRSVCVDDPRADPRELQLLQELGYSALLMLPLELRGETWGLVEVYRAAPRPFGPVEIRAGLARLGSFL